MQGPQVTQDRQAPQGSKDPGEKLALQALQDPLGHRAALVSQDHREVLGPRGHQATQEHKALQGLQAH